MKKIEFVFIILNIIFTTSYAKEIESMTCLELIVTSKNNKRQLDLAMKERDKLYEQEMDEEKLETLSELVDRYTQIDENIKKVMIDKKCLSKKK